jgi:hypothetical protein
MHLAQVMVIGKVQDIGLVFTELLLAGRDPKIADRFVRSRGGLALVPFNSNGVI